MYFCILIDVIHQTLQKLMSNVNARKNLLLKLSIESVKNVLRMVYPIMAIEEVTKVINVGQLPPLQPSIKTYQMSINDNFIMKCYVNKTSFLINLLMFVGILMFDNIFVVNVEH